MCSAGIGKTTLAKEICLRWARDGFLSEDFDAVVLIPMRAVWQQSLEQAMIMFCGEKLYQQFYRSGGSRCLIILEGLHELRTHIENHPFLVRLLQHSVFEKAVLLVTSRPRTCGYLVSDRTIEILGLATKDSIDNFVLRSFPNDIPSAREFLQLLKEYSNLRSLCYIPLVLVILLDFFRCSTNRLPLEIYHLLVGALVQREIRKENSEYNASSMATDDDKIEALCKQLGGIPRETANTILMLSRLAYLGFTELSSDRKRKFDSGHVINFKESKLLFTESDLMQCDINITTEFDGFGLLNSIRVHDLLVDAYVYHFIHTNIQEFLCLLYISLLPQQDHINCLSKVFECNNNFKTWLNFEFTSPLSKTLLIDCKLNLTSS